VWLRNHLVNPVVRAVGHSPAHRLLGQHLVLLSYTGRRTGLRRELPVMAAATGEDLVVLVAQPEDKTWWQNFGPESTDVTVCRGGRAERRTIRRLVDGDPGRVHAVSAYQRTYPRIRVDAGSPVLVISPTDG